MRRLDLTSHLAASGTPRGRSARAYIRLAPFLHLGWVPAERVIDAAAECGGAEKVECTKTRRKFVQGLIAALAGYYINIYSPYDGRVICKGHIGR